jgi:hypothetical protein
MLYRCQMLGSKRRRQSRKQRLSQRPEFPQRL